MITNKKSCKNKIFVAVIVLGAIMISVITAVFATNKGEESYRTITVIEISGTVGVVHNDIEYAAYAGMHLEEGYTVVTSGNSYVRLLLDDDKYVKLEAGSKAVFEEVGKGKTAIRLERGSLISEITKSLDADEDFIVNTPNAVLAVRGTLFRVNLERTENGELNTDVITYGGAVASKRVQPNGEVEDVEVTISEGFRATVNMDDKKTVYVVDDVKIDIDSLINSETDQNNNSSDGDKKPGVQFDLSSVLMPVSVEDIPDADLVDLYFAIENGHDMFIETEDVSVQLEKRGIDITEQTSVYDIAEKIENSDAVVIPDDNVPLTTEKTEEAVTEVIWGPPTDGFGTVTTHEHTEVIENISATCTTAGKTVVKCSECKEIISETIIPATGHTTKTTRVNPTCMANGSEKTICTVCNITISETVLSVIGHKAVYCGTKDAHTECEFCRVVLSVNHSYEKVITKATCTENGKTTYKCECGYTYDEKIPATGHISVNGGTKYAHTICGTCGDALNTTHQYSETVTKEATCEENGEKTFTCSCGYSYKETVKATGHTDVNGGTADAHTICSTCGETLNATHQYSETVTKKARCKESGEKTFTCSCGYSYKEAINATGHTDVNGGTADAHTICGTCGETLNTTHQYSETVTKEATCEENGEKTLTCSCGYSYKEAINATGHTEVNGGTADAHTVCKNCDVVFVTVHSYTKTIDKKEDCVTDGSYIYSCDCGYSYTETIPALGHTEVNAGMPDIHTKCSICGISVKDGTYHNYTEEITIENTCTTNGELVHTCDCGWSYTEEVPASHKQSEDGLTCINGCGGVWVDLNSNNFPDEFFLSYLSSSYDSDGNNALIGNEVTGVVTINVSGDSQTDGGYTDLTGINKFVNLTTVNCAYNADVEILDLSGLESLESLDVTGLTSLKKLNVSGCTKLTEDVITGLETCTALTEINLSGCTNVTELNLNANNRLETVNLNGCTSLTAFTMGDDSKQYFLSSINLTDCNNLEVLELNNASGLQVFDFSGKNKIKSIDLGGCQQITYISGLSGNTSLESLSLGGLNRLTEVDVSACTALADLNISACTALETLNLGYSGITTFNGSTSTINLSSYTNLKYVYLNDLNSSFDSINVSNNSSLKEFSLNANDNIKELDFSSSTEIELLMLSDLPALTTLSTNNCTSLQSLSIMNTGLTMYSVIGSSALTTLNVYNNTSLSSFTLTGATSLTDVKLSAGSENYALTDLELTDCGITSLDVSYMKGLETLNITNSVDITSLDVSNTQISTLDISDLTKLKILRASNCINLSSIGFIDNTTITDLDLSRNTAITSLDITNCTSLASLNASGCTGLATFTTGENTALTDLNLSGCTSITELDVSTCTALENFNASGVAVEVIDLSYSENITTVNVSNCTSMTTLAIAPETNDKLTSLDVSGCTAMTDLQIDNSTALEDLNLSGLTSLTSIYLYGTTGLKTVDVSNTNVGSLDLSACSNITSVVVTGSRISSGGVTLPNGKDESIITGLGT